MICVCGPTLRFEGRPEALLDEAQYHFLLSSLSPRNYGHIRKNKAVTIIRHQYTSGTVNFIIILGGIYIIIIIPILQLKKLRLRETT